MPIHCELGIAKLSTDEFGELDYRVMRHAFDSQNDLGRLADERIYQADLAARLTSAGMGAYREPALQLSYMSFSKELFLDLVVSNQAVYEIKAAKSISKAHVGQLLNYLMLLDLSHGKVINFGSGKVESRFVNVPIESSLRRAFEIEDAEYQGNDWFQELVVGLIRDWGTSLSLSLYKEAIVSLLGGIEKVEVMLPLVRDGVSLGNQRYQLVEDGVAFKLTALTKDIGTYYSQLQRLVKFSPLRKIHWVNIAHQRVSFITVLGSSY